LLLAQPELLAPPLAMLPVPRVALPPAGHPLSLSLLRHVREHARTRGGRLRLRGAHPHHLQGSGKALKRVNNSKNRLNWK
jgi:hypothetical protein